MFLLFSSFFVGKNAFASIEPIPFPTVKHINKGCIVTGCSSELCVDGSIGPVNSLCVWRDEYTCLKNAECETQDDGNCGWTKSEEYFSCIGGNIPIPTVTLSPSPSIKPICGNNICEPGESYNNNPDDCNKTISSKCLMPAMSLCPEDCETKPTVLPVPECPTVIVNGIATQKCIMLSHTAQPAIVNIKPKPKITNTVEFSGDDFSGETLATDSSNNKTENDGEVGDLEVENVNKIINSQYISTFSKLLLFFKDAFRFFPSLFRNLILEA